MANRPTEETAKQPRPESARRFARGEDAVEWVMGAPMSEQDAREVEWYERLRLAMRDVRNAAGKQQSAIAAALGRTQSEISRLERGVGPGTGIGRIKSYFEACGAQFGCAAINAQGEVVLDGLGLGVRVGEMAEPQIGIAGGVLMLGEMQSVSRVLEAVDRQLKAAGMDTRSRERILNRSLRSVTHEAASIPGALEASTF